MSDETIARRYANALADVAVKAGSSEEIKGELKSWEDLIFSSDDLSAAFANPSIAHSSKENVLESLIKRSKPSVTTANFLRVLLKNSRLTNLPSINKKLGSELEERNGIVTGSVISARELSDEEKKAFEEGVGQMTGKKVRLGYDIDESLIGGSVTRIGSTVIDGSVRTQLVRLQEKMINSQPGIV